MRAPDVVSIERVSVGNGRARARVRVAAGAPIRTSAYPGLAGAVRSALPGIARHRCESGSAHGIEAELDDTELPHLLEHMALELMALSGSPRSLAGETVWDFVADGRGVFDVSIEYDDDLVALCAFGEAATLLNRLTASPGGQPDVAGHVRRVAAARHM
jgi:hypothetical protein